MIMTARDLVQLPQRLILAGSGSIAVRHARLWRYLQPAATITRVRLDGRAAARPEIDSLVDGVVDGWEAALEKGPQAAIVANAAIGHVAALRVLIDANVPVMVEKPLADRPDELHELIEFADRRKATVLMAYCLRHHPLVRWALDRVGAGEIGRPLAVRAQVGQHLDGWRPGADPTRTVGAKRHLGGGALRELSHEIELALAAGGPAVDVSARIMRSGTLEGDADDLALVTIGHREGTLSEVSMNMLEWPARRVFSVLGETASVHVDFVSSRAELASRDEVRVADIASAATSGDAMYLAQLRHFAACVSGAAEPMVSLRDGAAVVDVIELAEQSSRRGCVVEAR